MRQSGASTTVRFNWSPPLLCQNQNQIRLDKKERPSLVKVTPFGVVQFYNCLCAKSGPLPKLVRKKKNTLFYRWFLKSCESCLLLFMAWPSLIDTDLYSCQPEGSFYGNLWRIDESLWYRSIWHKIVATHIWWWRDPKTLVFNLHLQSVEWLAMLWYLVQCWVVSHVVVPCSVLSG